MKECSSCKIQKDESFFCKNKSRKDGLNVYCKECANMKSKMFDKEKRKQITKTYYNKNKEICQSRNDKWRDNNKEHFIETRKINRRKYKKNRRETDEKYRFSENLRSRILIAFKTYSKNGKTLSCSEYGINFDAIFEKIGPRPSNTHHLDHIIPLSYFNLDIPEHVRLAHLPANLQWLDATDNLIKGDRLLDISEYPEDIQQILRYIL